MLKAAWPSPDGIPPQAEASQNVAVTGSAMLVVVAVALFAWSDFLAARLSVTGLATILIYRQGAFLLAGLLFTLGGTATGTRSARPIWQFWRALLLFGSAAFFIASLESLDVPSATSISFATPAIVTLLAIPLLGEIVQRRRWIATAIGLVGILILVRPGSDAFSPASILPLASALCGASAIILTRKIGTDDPVQITILWSAGIGLVLSIAAALVLGTELGAPAFPTLLMGALYAAGQILLIIAYRTGESSYLAPFSYAQVPIAVLITSFATSLWPSGLALLGMALIVGAGIYTLLREGVLAALRKRSKVRKGSIRPAQRLRARQGERGDP